MLSQKDIVLTEIYWAESNIRAYENGKCSHEKMPHYDNLPILIGYSPELDEKITILLQRGP